MNSVNARFCSRCGEEKKGQTQSNIKTYGSSSERRTSYEEYDRPSAAWYLVAFLFGLIGGIIAYVACRDEDEGMASTCIWIGVLTTFIGIALYLWFVSSIF